MEQEKSNTPVGMSLLGFHRHHPVFQLETRRRFSSKVMRVIQTGFVPVLLALTSLAIIVITTLVIMNDGDIEFAVTSALGFSLLAMLFIQLIAGAVVNVLTLAYASPMISGEIELQSWGLLRTTTLTIRDIVFAKYAATAALLRGSLLGLIGLRLVSLITGLILLASTLLRDSVYYASIQEWQQFWEDGFWLPIVVTSVTIVAFYITQPLIQFLLTNALGILASAHTGGRSRAMAGSLALRLLAWISSLFFHGALIWALGFLILGNWSSGGFAALDVYDNIRQPTDIQIAWGICLTIALYLASTMLAQIGAAITSLGIAQARARRIG